MALTTMDLKKAVLARDVALREQADEIARLRAALEAIAGRSFTGFTLAQIESEVRGKARRALLPHPR